MSKYLYDQFQPYTTVLNLPGQYPCEVTIIDRDGVQSTLTIQSGWDTCFDKAVAFKVHAPSRAQQIAKATGVTQTAVQAVLNYLDSETKAEAPKFEWIDKWLSENGYINAARVLIKNWFNDPEKYPAVELGRIGNTILTVKAVPGGRVVVAPAGHTLSYSKARSIWLAIKTGETRYLDGRPSVGEYFGKRRGIRYTDYGLSFNTDKSILIGCQTIPYSAMADLAEREGW